MNFKEKVLYYLKEESIGTASNSNFIKLKKYSPKVLKFLSKKYEILKNPTIKEINKLSTNDVRIILDKRKVDIYVSNSELLHNAVAEKLGFSYKWERESGENYEFVIGKVTSRGVLLTVVGKKKNLEISKFKKKFNYLIFQG